MFVNRGECTTFEILRDGQVARWNRVEESSSLAGEFPAINAAVSIVGLSEKPIEGGRQQLTLSISFSANYPSARDPLRIALARYRSPPQLVPRG